GVAQHGGVRNIAAPGRCVYRPAVPLLATEGAVDEVGEDELLECAAAGRVLDASGDRVRRRVSAELLRRLCLLPRDRVDPRGIQLERAMVYGSLDVAGLDIPFDLRFDACEFESPL